MTHSSAGHQITAGLDGGLEHDCCREEGFTNTLDNVAGVGGGGGAGGGGWAATSVEPGAYAIWETAFKKKEKKKD